MNYYRKMCFIQNKNADRYYMYYSMDIFQNRAVCTWPLDSDCKGIVYTYIFIYILLQIEVKRCSEGEKSSTRQHKYPLRCRRAVACRPAALSNYYSRGGRCQIGSPVFRGSREQNFESFGVNITMSKFQVPKNNGGVEVQMSEKKSFIIQKTLKVH